MLKQNGKGVYYIIDYLPSNRWESRRYEEEEIFISQKLSRYKKEDKTVARDYFTNELKKAIVELSNNHLDKKFDEIALFAIPPSKVGKYSAVRYSIDKIADDEEVQTNLKGIKKIHNCSNVLVRTKDVKTSHSKDERRAYKHEHILSIESTVEDFTEWPDNRAYIILDDITTTGNQMEVCKEVLVDNYANEDNIYMLAIGATVR